MRAQTLYLTELRARADVNRWLLWWRTCRSGLDTCRAWRRGRRRQSEGVSARACVGGRRRCTGRSFLALSYFGSRPGCGSSMGNDLVAVDDCCGRG